MRIWNFRALTNLGIALCLGEARVWAGDFPSEIPEPGTVVLVAVGLGLVVYRARRLRAYKGAGIAGAGAERRTSAPR